MQPKAAPILLSDAAQEAGAAARKRFYFMAGGGLLIVLVLAYFVLRPAAEVAVAATPAAGVPTATAAAPAAPAAPVASPVPGTSGGGSGGRSAGGGGGRPGGGGAAPARPPAPAATAAGQPFTRERGLALGLSPRAASALADSASRSRAAPTSGRAAVTRATVIMSGPASGTVLVTVPSGTPLTLSGCQDVGGAPWCQATHSGFSGWVRQSDVGL